MAGSQVTMVVSPRLRLLGGFSLSDASGAQVSLTLRKTEALIAYLASNGARSQQREYLASLLWSESTQAGALQSLRQARLTLMRNLQAHGLPIIEFSRREISLDDAHLEIDVTEFLALQAAGDQDSLAQAAELYRGEFLAGLETGSEPFDDWLRQARSWYGEQIETTLQKLLTLQEEAGALESAIRTAKRLLALDPLREDMHRWLMRAFAAAGHRTSALATYDACRNLLHEELGVSPEPETEELYRSLLLGAPPTQPGMTGNGAAPRGGNATPPAAAGGGAKLKPKAALAPISNLTNSALAILQVAAVCAGHFTRELLDAIGERPADECEAELKELETRGLLQWDEGRQRARIDDAVRQKVVDQLLPSHRKHLHYAAAAALQELQGPEGEENGYEIAEHYRQAAKWALAGSHQLKLARRELDSGRLEGVEPLLKKALADLAMLPAGAERGRLELDVLLLQSCLAELHDNLAGAEESLGALWPALKAHGDSQHWIGALLARSRLRSRRGQRRRAYSAIRLIPQSCKGGQIDSMWLLTERFATFAEIITEEGWSPAVLQQRQRASAPRACEAESAALQALCHAKQEKFAAAYGACNQAIQIASDLPDPTCLIACLQTLAFVQVWDGEAETALPTLERALKLAIGRGDLPRQYTTHGYRGFALMNARRPVEAAAALQLALEMSENLKLPFMAAMFSAWLAGALVESGRADEAVETARHAVRLANERNEPWARSVALRFLGQALALSTAESSKLVHRILRSAQEIQSGLGLPFETAHTAIARNKILRALH